MYLFKQNTLLPNYYVYLLLDNICMLLLKNIMSDPLVREIYPMVNTWCLCNQYKHRVLFLLKICQDKYEGHILYSSELKYHSHHDKAFFLIYNSIRKIICCYFVFSTIYALRLLFLNNDVPLLIILIVLYF